MEHYDQMRTSVSKAKGLLEELAKAVTDPGDPAASAWVAERLATLSGPGWLSLDETARSPFWRESGSPLDRITVPPPGTGLLAAIAGSMSRDGRVREHAVRVLAESDEPVARAAIAVRVADWVVQVRSLACMAVFASFSADHAAAAVPVLLAVRERHRGRPPADEYLTRLSREPIPTVDALAAAGNRAGRRWALRVLADRGHLTVDRLARMAMHDPDPVIALWSARTVADEPGALSAVGGRFLSSLRPGVRAFAIERLADDQLPEPELRRLLLDRSGAVRSAARWRWKQRFGDTAPVYREVLAASRDPSVRSRHISAALRGLSDDNADDLTALAVPYLAHGSPAVRWSAARAIGDRGAPDDIVLYLTPLLHDSSRKVATAAARHVRGWGVPAEIMAELEAGTVVSRRIALSLRQYEGGWARVQADLRAMNDDDPAIAHSGHGDLLSWLRRGAASNYSTPPAEAVTDITRLLHASALTFRQRRTVAFAVGIPGAASWPDSAWR